MSERHLDKKEQKIFHDAMRDSCKIIEKELKPCPFCGGQAKVRNFCQDKLFCVDCFFGCGIYGPSRETEEEAVSAWNRRARNVFTFEAFINSEEAKQNKPGHVSDEDYYHISRRAYFATAPKGDE